MTSRNLNTCLKEANLRSRLKVSPVAATPIDGGGVCPCSLRPPRFWTLEGHYSRSCRSPLGRPLKEGSFTALHDGKIVAPSPQRYEVDGGKKVAGRALFHPHRSDCAGQGRFVKT